MKKSRQIILWAWLAIVFAGPAIGTELRENDATRDLKSTLAYEKRVTLGCTEAPLPTEPSGPTWSFTVEDLGESAEITAWRIPCSPDDGMVLLTLEPIEGDITVCGVHFDVIQDSQQFDNVILRQDPNGSDSFCSNLLVTTTVAVDQISSGRNWNDDEAFTLVNFFAEERLDIGPYKFSDYSGGDVGPMIIDGRFSGSWFDPSRNGEGFVLEVGENTSGPVITLYWFTYRDGQPYWLIGIKELSPGQTEVTMDLLEFSGTGFGANFDPSEVTNRTWGEITLKFDSCTTGTAEWNSTVGLGSGSFDLERITLGIEGHLCSE